MSRPSRHGVRMRFRATIGSAMLQFFLDGDWRLPVLLQQQATSPAAAPFSSNADGREH
jgi:hypothetical protein